MDEQKLGLQELKLARIPILRINGHLDMGLKINYIGILNGFVFEKTPSYWVVRGYMPLNYAKEIYNIYGATPIRVNGTAGGEDPSKAATVNPIYHRKLSDLHEKIPNVREFAKAAEEIIDDPKNPRYIKFYHIDNSAGLVVFADFVRNHDIRTSFVD